MTPPALELESLNDRQSEAVLCPGGPIMIVAGAGSGKTRVITFRIAKLVADGVAPHRILAVTFTNKAAREMRERIEMLVGDAAKAIWMGTFHSVCAKMLRIAGSSIGVDPNFVVYDDGDQLGIVKELIKARDLDDKSLQPRAVLSEISNAKERLTGPEKYKENAASFFHRIVADIYKDYNETLRRANALDFDDLLFKAVRMLEQSAPVREKYQDKFLHVMVDEYQDVNFSQYRLANTIADKHKNITVVGDDDQSIYAWRGADVGLMMRFTSDHPDATIVTLDQNYRSTQRILAAAHAVVRHNRSRNEKKLWTGNQEGQLVRVGEAGTETDEARLVVDAMLREVRTGRRAYSDFAVLYRTNAQSRALEEALITNRIPHTLVGGQRFYERKEIKDMVSYLRLVWNAADAVSLKRVVNTPARGIGPGTVSKAEAHALAKGSSLFEALSDPMFVGSLTAKAGQNVRGFIKVIEDARDIVAGGLVTPVLKLLLNQSGYLDELRADRSEDAQGRLENLQELVNVTAQYDASEGEDKSLGGFLETVALVSDIDMADDSGQGVTLMTLHSSKGLEFPVVFMVGMEEGIFPHSRSLGSDTELAEERRLCYVGMTRAREELFLTCAQRRAQYGQANFNTRSRFIDDIPLEMVDRMVGSTGSAGRQVTHSVRPERSGSYVVTEKSDIPASTWVPPFKVGEKVSHAKFGLGIVVACCPMKSDTEVTVAFPGETGIKKLVQSIAKLESA